jgi:hypothetical protein
MGEGQFRGRWVQASSRIFEIFRLYYSSSQSFWSALGSPYIS